MQKEILSDKTERGKEKPWREHKVSNEYLAMAYSEIDKKKAIRLRECATRLTFSVQADGKKRLKNANFCRVRLCPMCTWRRSLKVHANVIKILDNMEQEYGYIFLTLTVKNCKGQDLAEQLDKLMAAWDSFSRRKTFKQAVKGWYRGLEITHNVNPLSPSYDTFHPHFHCLLAVNKSYFKKQEYLSQEDWVELWKQSLKVDYKPVVDVRKVKGSHSQAVAEAAKYAVKSDEVVIPDDWDLTLDTVRLLDRVLDKRRFVAFGGKMKAVHRQLNLEDEMDGNLVNIEAEAVGEEPADREQCFFWNIGYQQYVGA